MSRDLTAGTKVFDCVTQFSHGGGVPQSGRKSPNKQKNKAVFYVSTSLVGQIDPVMNHEPWPNIYSIYKNYIAK